MKSILLIAFLLLKSTSYAQITFEELDIPKDFNIQTVRQSPVGEYFIQTVNDDKTIYTSQDGIAWTRESLPVSHTLYDIDFFTDGTPVLKNDPIGVQEHLIRRNGAWHTLFIHGIMGKLLASFIKGDTLFVFQNETFAYSLDKGKSFTTVFKSQEPINDHTAHLWKPENHYILHYTTGSTNYLSVFDEQGERILHQTLGLGYARTAYNTCGQILLYTPPQIDHYYLITEPGLILQQGYCTDIFPGFLQTEIFSQDGQYFLWNKNTIYRSTGCNFAWEEFAVDDLIDSSQYAWINQSGAIFLNDKGSNHFIKKDIDSDSLIRHYPDIDYPHVFKVNESKQDDQFVLTSDFLFHKKSFASEWEQTDSVGGLNYEIQYSPNGDLYINKKGYLLHSQDNGASFTVIDLPLGGGPENINSMLVLGDGIIFMALKLESKFYYTLNNGQDWIQSDVVYPPTYPLVKLVNTDIMVVDLSDYNMVSRIDITTNQVTTETLAESADLLSGAVISEDGTVYFQRYNIFLEKESLFRYRFGEGVKFLGHFDELTNAVNFGTLENVLIAFNNDSYYVWDGESLIAHSYFGLPEFQSGLSFTLSENGYVYAIVDYNRIFRSTKLSVGTKDVTSPLEIQIYPNPANTFISISNSEGDLNGFDSYEIFDILGCRQDQSNALNGQPISVSHLAAGMYMLLLKENEVVIATGKFIKQ